MKGNRKKTCRLAKRCRIRVKRVKRVWSTFMLFIKLCMNQQLLIFLTFVILAVLIAMGLMATEPKCFDETGQILSLGSTLLLVAVTLMFGRRRATVIINALIFACSLGYGLTYMAQWAQQLGLSASVLLCLLALYTLYLVFQMLWNYTTTNEVCKPNRPDWLFRGRFYAKVHACIRMQDADKGHAYALYGQWGSGKSHLLQYLDRRLSHKYLAVTYDDPQGDKCGVYDGEYRLCWLPLWHYSSIEDAWHAVVKALLNAIADRSFAPNSRWLPRLLAYASRYILPNHQVVEDAIQRLSLLGDSNTVEGDVILINKHLIKKKQRVVLLVEDLERCDVRLIELLLPFIERLRKIKGLTILCAADKVELERKCHGSAVITGDLQGYLDKVFDLSFDMPSIPLSLVPHYFEKYVQEQHNHCPFLLEFANSSNLAFDSPRQIEQVANRLASLETMYFPTEHYSSPFKKDDVRASFYVDILRTRYHDAYVELLDPKNRRAAENADFEGYRTAYRGEAWKWPSELTATEALFAADSFFKSLLKMLCRSFKDSTHLELAFSESYLRREFLTEWEKQDIINSTQLPLKKPVKELIRRYFGANQPEQPDRAVANLLYTCWKDGYEPLCNMEQRKREFFISAIQQMQRDYDISGPYDYMVPLWDVEPLAYAYLETAFAYLLSKSDNTCYRDLLPLLLEKVKFEHLSVLYGRMVYTSSDRFEYERASSNMQVMSRYKSVSDFKVFKNQLASVAGRRMADFIHVLFAATAFSKEGMQEGVLDMFDKINNAEEWQKFKSAFCRYFNDLSLLAKIQFFMSFLRSLCVKVSFPNHNVYCHAISLRRLELFEQVYGVIGALINREDKAVTAAMNDIAQSARYTIAIIMADINSIPKVRTELSSRGYRTATARLIKALRKLDRQIGAIIAS